MNQYEQAAEILLERHQIIQRPNLIILALSGSEGRASPEAREIFCDVANTAHTFHILAHEVGHIVFNHKRRPRTGLAYIRQELKVERFARQAFEEFGLPIDEAEFKRSKRNIYRIGETYGDKKTTTQQSRR